MLDAKRWVKVFSLEFVAIKQIANNERRTILIVIKLRSVTWWLIGHIASPTQLQFPNYILGIGFYFAIKSLIFITYLKCGKMFAWQMMLLHFDPIWRPFPLYSRWIRMRACVFVCGVALMWKCDRAIFFCFPHYRRTHMKRTIFNLRLINDRLALTFVWNFISHHFRIVKHSLQFHSQHFQSFPNESISE